MPRRYYGHDNAYWDGGGANPATPSYYSGWQETNAALRVALKETKPGNAFSQTTIQKNTSGAPKYCLARVYVSDPFTEAFTLSGTVKGQILVNEQAAANDACRAIVIRVWDPATDTFRFPNVLVHLPSILVSEFPSVGAVNRKFPPELPINSVAVRPGDRLVVEVGAVYFTTSTSGTTLIFRNGNPIGTGDLPEDEVYTIPELAPWIEFSASFPGEAPTIIAGPPKEFLADKKSALRIGSFDYAFELQAPDGTAYDVTERVALDGISSITLAVERNLHEFRAGDITLTLDDGDGFFTDLFANLQTTDRWGLTIHRKGIPYFTGSIPPIDSIHFDKKQATVELTALDLSKLLEDTPAEMVARERSGFYLTATASSGTNALTLNTTVNLFNGDRLKLTDDPNSEEVEIAIVGSATVVTLTQNLVATYTTATIVELATPFYRYKTPAFLIHALLDAVTSIISGRVVRIAGDTSVAIPIFSDQSTNGLTSTEVPNAWTQKALKHFARVGTASFDQVEPADPWISVTPDRQWIDWTPYRTQAEGEPAMFATLPAAIVALGGDVETVPIEFTSGALVAYFVQPILYGGGTPHIAVELWQWTSADGVTWSAGSLLATLDTVQTALPPGFYPTTMGCELDSNRNRVYFWWNSPNMLTGAFGYYDVAGATVVPLAGSQRMTRGIRYSREYDGIVAYNETQNRVEVWRDAAILFSYSGSLASSWRPKTTRFFNGAWYDVAYPLSIPSVFFSNDDLSSVTQIILAGKPTSGTTDCRITIVNGTVRVAVNANSDPASTAQARFFIGASLFAGTIPYADFEGLSIINALDEMAVLLNAVFFVDPDGIAYFLLRTLDSGETKKAIDDLVLERREDPVWLEVYDYVEFKLPDGSVASAGTKTSTSRNLTVQTQLVTSFSVGTAAALYLLDFYVVRRRMNSVALEDDETRYRLMDPVELDGIDWLVYSFQRDLATYELSMELLEKVE